MIGQSAKCPDCGKEIVTTHQMQTLYRQMITHLRKAHGMTHRTAELVNTVRKY